MAKQKISNSAIFLCFLLCACGPSKTNKCSHHVCIEKGVDATCLEPGMTEKKYCDICGEVFSDHEEIKPHGHNVVHIPELEAGIQYKGYKEWEYCDICGTVLVEKEETDRIVSKDEVFSKTYENTAYFTINLHKDNVPHTTDIIVEHSGLEERFHLNNSIQFEYPNMEANTLYRFVFDTRYEDGDFENLIDVTRYINTSDPSLPFVEIETANTEWPSSLGIKNPYDELSRTQTENNYVYCSLSLFDKNKTKLFSSYESEDEKFTNARIKLRGNTSVYSEKTPYKLKLASKTDLLKDLLPNRSAKTYKDKEWILLAEKSLKTAFGFGVNSYISGENQLNGQFVEVYVNGDYRGVYYLCEAVKQGSGSGAKQSRVAIDDDGFIVENDHYWWNEDVHFKTNFSSLKHAYTFKYPDSDDVEDYQIEYIKNKIIDFENIILNNDQSYTDLIEVESFSAWLLTHDLLGTFDSDGSNIYITKKDSADSKLKMGPCWDFDSIKRIELNGFCNARTNEDLYFAKLLEYESFMESYYSIFDAKKDDLRSTIETQFLQYPIGELNNAISCEDLRWSTQSQSCMSFYEGMLEYLQGKIEFINSSR